MRILFDQNVPADLRRFLRTHEVSTAHQMHWSELENGDLLTAAEGQGFDLFITCDQKMAYQQNLAHRRIAILELTKNNWPSIAPRMAEILDAVDAAVPGSYRVVVCRYVYTGGRRTR